MAAAVAVSMATAPTIEESEDIASASPDVCANAVAEDTPVLTAVASDPA
ncbi:MAG: hypothetical protein KDB04_12185 [Acidimicrobiales bacterium]|nr:hypothetical protein [Acidimicrobiales bacterium]